MGIAEENAAPSTAESGNSAKPRFQVVHVPGVFTRGRWRCWDYREVKNKEENPTAESTDKVIKFDENKENDCGAIASTSVSALAEPMHPSTHSPQREESSTIVVTSIAPAPPTPIHGTPSSLVGIPTPPYGTTEMSGSVSWPEDATTTVSVSPGQATHHAQSQTVIVTQQQTMVPSQGTVIVTAGAGPTSSPPPPPSSLQSTPEMIHSVTEVTPQAPTEEEPPSAPSSGNIVAIDNKIEQAMDLVKTHLTFAVREEVEVLRSTISDLENKVSQLEQQNAYLRRYAPPDVLSNLPSLIAHHKQSAPPTAAPNPALLVQAHAQSTPTPMNAVASPSYCPATSNFASSLNTVVPPPPNPR